MSFAEANSSSVLFVHFFFLLTNYFGSVSTFWNFAMRNFPFFPFFFLFFLSVLIFFYSSIDTLTDSAHNYFTLTMCQPYHIYFKYGNPLERKPKHGTLVAVILTVMEILMWFRKWIDMDGNTGLVLYHSTTFHSRIPLYVH